MNLAFFLFLAGLVFAIIWTVAGGHLWLVLALIFYGVGGVLGFSVGDRIGYIRR